MINAEPLGNITKSASTQTLSGFMIKQISPNQDVTHCRSALSHFPAGKRDFREDIRLYCGLSEETWCGVPVAPGAYACISPISGRKQTTKRTTYVSVPHGVEVIQDSGAFSDSWTQRLTFSNALNRQIAHAEKFHYSDRVTHRATYDLLIDEVWSDGNRSKRRWSVADAEAAIDETVNAAAWLNSHREGLSLVISAQGVDAPQYLRCVQRLLPYFHDNDLLGLGGWCIIGKMPRQMMPVFKPTVDVVIPFIAAEGIKQVHIWGVIYAPALAYLTKVALQYGVFVSTDSAGVSLNPVYGEWGYASWRNNNYVRPSGELLGLDRVEHVQLSGKWLASFTDSIDYLSHIPAGKSDIDPRLPSCAVCGNSMPLKRSHAKTCSPRCRKALSRGANGL